MQDGFLELTGPVHARVKLPVAGQTVREQLAGTTLPPAAVSAPFRRIARPRGPIIRRVLAGHSRPAQALQTLAKGIIAPVPPLNRPPTNGQLPNGTQVLDPVPAATPPWHSRYPKIVESDRSPAALADTRLAEDPDAARRFRRAAEDKLGELANRQPPGPPPQPDLGDVWHQLLYQLHPERSIPNRVRNRLQVPPGLQWSEDELEPIMAAPEFDQAMYRPLKQISQDLLLPGLRYVPANTLSLVETNPQFIESYMVGLNHEMSAELLWREYPSDQRGSYFRQFWDLKGSVPDGNAPDRDQPDLAPIHTWGRSGDNGLGEHLIRGQGSSGGPPGMAVLIVRGELLRLYPNTMIYAVQGMWESDEDKRRPDPNSPEKYPIFRGKLDPDATFLGFDLDISQIRGSTNKSDGRPGWFFIIEGPPTEPRFGLDELLDFSDNNVGQDPDTWHAISWGDLIRPQGSEQANEKALAQMAYAPVDPPASSKYRSPDLKGRGSTPAPDSETYWGFNAAHMAYITLQLPVRLAIHADDMLPS
jgi:hypothetical protein